LFSSIVFGQLEGFKFRELSRDSLLSIAHEIIKTEKTCTFITVDENSNPQARILATFPTEGDWKMWFGTSTNSRKAEQIKKNPNTMVFYFEPQGNSYVSFAGKARLVNDAELKNKYWKESWKVYYPNPEKDYILIEFKPDRMEICSYKYKLFWDSTGKPAFVEF
jgi:general stress protein 26